MENGERHRIQFTSNEAIASDELCDHRMSAALSSCFTVLFSVVIVWYLLYVNLSPYLTAFPGGSVTSLYLLYVAGAAAGWLVEEVAGLPPLLGMLVAGIALQNCGLYVLKASWCIHLVAIMREAALSVILIKGGLGLDPGQLRRLSGSVIKLAIFPCVAEALAAAVIAHYTLTNLTWEWALTLGFVLSAVSPAVLVPRLLWLKNRGYGESNGVGTLVIAASSLDDILSISAFGVLLGLVFSEGNLVSKIIQGPVDVCIGVALGMVWGLIMIYMPPSPWANKYSNHGDDEDHKDQTADQLEQATMTKRCFLLGAGGFLAVTGSQLYGYPGAGPLACIISAFVANTGWKWRLKKRLEHIGVPVFEIEPLSKQKNTVEGMFDKFWFALQPILFASIGTEIKFELLQGSDILLVGLIVLAGGLIIRLIVTSCCISGTGFDWKEMLFINIAWLPKATVQAALAPVALDRARTKGTDEDVESATQLLTVAVISILVTAPIGAIGIQWLGPKLLKKTT
ncbi:sodium/hydrogen exchanger 9B2-like isoform X2 [Adelges cooleyi]|nr:sodium/hydrogen exchanger 9B2-like isoform X2 [Adelges cooleyi]XP_050431788.1 sodium/hydrogen exchanger 9B2-like isoform X2 [Adelges cooleyi]XP_050431789.1 sodium/hydrogen exchanger 9B2-like isoform X2 [Adelges cooleyi]